MSVTVRSVTKYLFERYLREFELSDDLINLSNKAIKEIDNYPIDKLSRWLGFVQGYIIFTNQTSVNNERDLSRSMFHEAYKNEGINIPSSYSANDN